MGIYLNPGSGRFRKAVNSEIYVDKTGLISYANSVLGTENGYICVSRPRRFGKSMAAGMLAAYYDRGADSSEMFAPFEIARDPSFGKHRNKYDVLFLNMQDFLSRAKGMDEMLALLNEEIALDFEEKYGGRIGGRRDAVSVMQRVSQSEDISFVVLIDEWDCVFRVHKEDREAQRAYLDFLRLFLKDKEYVALAYMTGILPVKKYGTHSALNMFREFSMTDPRQLARYVGFTQDEVDALCERYGMDGDAAKSWYDGYAFPGLPAVYSPQSVIEAMLSRRFGNYWTRTETYEALKVYIDLNHDGLRDAVIALLAGSRAKANVTKYQNDMVTFSGYEDVLALLVHLGYLGYDLESGEVFIPNKEVSGEFVNAVEDISWGGEVAKAVRASEELLKAAWALDGAAVAAGVERAHLETSHLTYNDENALAYTLSLAFYAAREHYTVVREMPAGRGFADLVFLPRHAHPGKPAMVAELKWDRGAESAIAQIRRREYPAALRDYEGGLLLLGVSYDKASRVHECLVERWLPENPSDARDN